MGNVFDGSDLNTDIASGKVPPAATTAMQSEMFVFGREYLDKRNYRRLSSAHWSANNRERSWYNILAKADVPIFPFGSGSGGNVGEGWNIQWFVIPIHISRRILVCKPRTKYIRSYRVYYD